ncbi:autotransporter outer membrane beta-barrel domain-containing protein [Microvirga sp. W0021]|uniref:Autotransporter outer membrane beta-barrel domain-containing protein n=1 Tax=Hohaiivirga grylli TaxID=3133970 RepID=A0ABV0BIA6_9HYPH
MLASIAICALLTTANAACVSTSDNKYTCSGNLTAPITINNVAEDIEVTTQNGFSLNTSSSDPALYLFGAGDVSYIDNYFSDISNNSDFIALQVHNIASQSATKNAYTTIETGGNINGSVFIISNATNASAKLNLTLSGNITNNYPSSYGYAVQIQNTTNIGNAVQAISLNSINSYGGGLYFFNSVSTSGDAFASATFTGDLISQSAIGLMVSSFTQSGTATANITARDITAHTDGIYINNVSHSGNAVTVISANDITSTAANYHAIYFQQNYALNGDSVAIINANSLHAVNGTGIYITSTAGNGRAYTIIKTTGDITAGAEGIVSRTFGGDNYMEVWIDVNNISSNGDAIHILDIGNKSPNLPGSLVDIITRGNVYSHNGTAIYTSTDDTDTHITVQGLVHGNTTAIDIIRERETGRTATLELHPGYALEGLTRAVVTDANSTAYLDLPNSHLVLGGEGTGRFDLTILDNSADADTTGDANRISGFGSLTKSGNSTWFLENTNNADPDNQFLYVNVNEGTLVLDNARLLLADTATNIHATGILTIAPQGTLSGTGASVVQGNVINSGTISLANNYTGGIEAFAGDTLTITGNYTGNNGRLVINTMLGDDDFPTERLIINGAASGQTQVTVVNIGGDGDQTMGNGIMIVQATESTPDAFVLANRVAAGAYEYSLYRGGLIPSDQNWYLRSTYTPLPTPDNPNPQPEPAIRSEVAVAMTIAPLALEYGYTMLGTLHERVGETGMKTLTPVKDARLVNCNDPAQNFRCIIYSPVQENQTKWASSGWARLFGDRGLHRPDNFMRRGPNYSYTFSGIQAGLDIYAREQTDGTLDKAGIYIGYGQISADITGQRGTKAGTVDMDAYTLGAYWTHISAMGWYTDAVVQGTWYSADARSTDNQRIKPNGFSILASLEAGYSFRLNNGWAIEPQAQIVYQNISFNNARDAYGLVRFSNNDSLRGRLGIRVTKTWNMGDEATPRLLTTWLRANIWHEFLGKTRTSYGSLDGSDFTPFHSYLKGTWAEVGAGASMQMTEAVNLFATGSYNRALDNKGREGWNGRLGVTVKW